MYLPSITYRKPSQEAIAGTQEQTFTVKFRGGSEQKAPIFFSGTPEKFLLHIQETISICRRKGLFDRYNTNLQASKKYSRNSRTPKKKSTNLK
jgi:hypothetical protein